MAVRLHSEEPRLAEENEQIKKKIRNALRIVDHELAQTSCTNAPPDGTDFFELIYECVHTRNQYLNFIDLKGHRVDGGDVTFAILQALFKGTGERGEYLSSLLALIVTYGDDSRRMSPEERHAQLTLAYEWKQLDFVKKTIMRYDQDWKVRILGEVLRIQYRRHCSGNGFE